MFFLLLLLRQKRNKEGNDCTTKSTYCKSCGAYIPEGRKKCLACGFPVEIPSLIDSEFENLRGHSGGKPIRYIDKDNVAEGFRICVDGYELNERGEILSVPNEKFGTTAQNDHVLNLAASLYDKARQDQADIDLDSVFSQTYFKVKLGGNTSTYYLGSNPTIECEDCEPIGGRTIDGSIQRNIATKRKINIELIER